MIHPTAIIHAKANLAKDVRVGPHAVIDEGVTLGAGCIVGPHVYLTGRTIAGENNSFHAGAVIGDLPQDLRFKGEETSIEIGSGNIFREHVTVHRSNHPEEPTRIGNHCFLMANSHVGHNTLLSDHVILANGALLAGHVQVGDRVFISGNCLVHQFVRIGKLAFMQGGSAISKDLPPFTVSRGDNGLCGLNVVGMRRAGFSGVERLEIRRLYHLLFRSGEPFRSAFEKAERVFQSPVALEMLGFIAGSKRGVVSERAKTRLKSAPREDES
jgi:UDP-N-acetylglucosamine acyltransferase